MEELTDYKQHIRQCDQLALECPAKPDYGIGNSNHRHLVDAFDQSNRCQVF